jgi:hypothetical protein
VDRNGSAALGGLMDAQLLWWVLAVVLVVVMTIGGFIFGYDTNDTASENTLMFGVFTLLSFLATYWTFDPLFPELNKWWALLIWPGWFSYLIYAALCGLRIGRQRKTLVPRWD